MHRYRVHSKATGNPRNAPGFLEYMRWEERKYNFKEERHLHIPSEKKLSAYYQINDNLRARLCRLRPLPDSERKERLVGLIHRRIDENMGLIFHERSPGNWPDLKAKFTFGKTQHVAQVRRLPARLPEAEQCYTGTDAYPV